MTTVPDAETIKGSRDEPLTLAAVSAGIAGRIRAIPELWITAEVLKVSTSHSGVFITLVGEAEARSKPPMLTVMTSPGRLAALPVELVAGNQVVALVTLSYWASSGKVAARVSELFLAGDGALLASIETLRRSLYAEGLFDRERKRVLPALPRKIGLITGANTDAESDVLSRTRERWSAARFEVRHVPVQGKSCPPAVIAALAELDALPEVDVIVIARGGGSATDLAGFSDEQLVRAVADCSTPVVSAIGHEPDRPILDDVADRRAGTPTQAASHIVIDVAGELAAVDRAGGRIVNAVLRRLDSEMSSLTAVASRPVMAAPVVLADRHLAEVDRAAAAIRRGAGNAVALQLSTLDTVGASLRALSPAGTLERGYAVVRRADGSPLGPANGVVVGTALDITLTDGHLSAITTETTTPNGESP